MNPGFSPALQLHAREIFLKLLEGNADELSRLNCDGEDFQNLVEERSGAAWRAAFAFVREGDSFETKIRTELAERASTLKPEETADLRGLQLDDHFLELRKRMKAQHADCNCPACQMRRKLEALEKNGPIAFQGDQAASIIESLSATLVEKLRSKKPEAPEATGDVAAEGTA